MNGVFIMKTGYPSIDKTHMKNEKIFYRHPFIPNMSVSNALDFMSIAYRKEVAIDCLGLNATYDEMLNSSLIMARAFKELGLKKGDIVAISMPNIYQAVISYLALNKIGVTTTFLNLFSSKEEVIHYLNEFESPIFLNYDKDYKYNLDIKKNTKVRQIITLSSLDLEKKEFNEKNKKIGYTDFIDFQDLKVLSDYYKGLYKTNYGGKENSLILFTSGTTGVPKAVVLTNRNILASCIYLKNSSNTKVKKGESTLVCVPFTYPYGFATSTLTSLLCGRKAILCPNLSKDNISYYFSKKPNIVFGSPALLELTKKYVLPNQDLSSVHTFISGGDFLTPSKNEEGVKFFKDHNANVVICNGSGNAETVGASTNAVGVKQNLESVGKILSGTYAIVMNDKYTEELKYGEEGILCISGEHVFKKYFKNSYDTYNAKFVYKGRLYFKTGNRGILYKNGYFKLTGRDSRYYIVSTLNKVYCDRVQLLMSYIDEIDDVAFVAKPDDDMLFVGIAYVVLKKGIVANDDVKKKIYAACRGVLISPNGDIEQLKENEVPADIVFVKSLPKTRADKIDYHFLEEDAKKLVLKK